MMNTRGGAPTGWTFARLISHPRRLSGALIRGRGSPDWIPRPLPHPPMARQKLSVLIPAFNEERNLADCIASVRWADEVVVVDSFSTDRTVAIAHEKADRVLQHEYENSAAQKNWAIPQVSHPWVLIVDADERVTPELRREIEGVLAADGPADGYRIRRENHFLGRRIVGCGWQRDWVLRLFRRDRGRYQERHVHADIVFPDGNPARVERLRGTFLHFTFESFDQYLGKFNRYTAWASKDRGRRTMRVHWWHLTLRPLWRFIRQYVFYGGFRDGLHGLVICRLAAYSVFMKYARLWEAQVRRAAKTEDAREQAIQGGEFGSDCDTDSESDQVLDSRSGVGGNAKGDRGSGEMVKKPTEVDS